MGEIFASWRDRDTALWGQQPIRLEHRLHEHPLFSPDSLADLIEHYQQGKYMLVSVGARGREKEWREGDLNGLSGHQVMDSIKNGRMWLNLLRVNEVDARYGELLDEIFEEIRQHLPDYATFNRINGILISSPEAQVYYHFDTSGQSLWQIAGRKRVYVYPNSPPFLKPQELEAVCLYHSETSVAYEQWYDEYATVFEIGPGQMLTWPLNAPHRIENLSFSISMTIEYQTAPIRRRLFVNAANGMLRNRLGIVPETRVSGLACYGKMAMYAAMKASGLLEKQRRQRRPITFRLDPNVPGRLIEA
jgi:hypothetical protein